MQKINAEKQLSKLLFMIFEKMFRKTKQKLPQLDEKAPTVTLYLILYFMVRYWVLPSMIRNETYLLNIVPDVTASTDRKES